MDIVDSARGELVTTPEAMETTGSVDKLVHDICLHLGNGASRKT
jgi:hypothetical protein